VADVTAATLSGGRTIGSPNRDSSVTVTVFPPGAVEKPPLAVTSRRVRKMPTSCPGCANGALTAPVFEP